MNPNDKAFDLHAKLRRIKLSYNSAVSLRDGEDVESAALIALRTTDRLHALMTEVAEANPQTKAYMDAVMANKLPDFEADRETLRREEARVVAGEAVDAKSFDLALRRLEAHIRVVDREVRGLFQTQNLMLYRTMTLIQRYGKKALAAAAVVALLFGGRWAWRTHELRKHSLKAEYFGDITLSKPLKSRLDPNIHFNWGYGAPFLAGPADMFSARWTGYLYVAEADTYDFQTEADDGVRLWIDDQIVVDDWRSHLPEKHEGRVNLSKGYHAIKLEYYDENANAEVSLRWRRSTFPQFRVIASEFFVSDEKYIK